VRTAKDGYLSLLSANTRQQIRRSLKGYEHRGKLAISVTQSLDETLSFFSGLCSLHQARWQDKGEKGAFGTAFSLRFHQHLVRAAFGKGELQMARIQAGDEVIGYLYNFVRNGHVYFYQNGFDYAAAGKLNPGHVAHYMAINYNAEAGHRTYDFLSGQQRYKRSLAGEEVMLYWATLQKRRALFALETAVRRALGRTDVQ
jgi:CelD/BcsL family acetyltransferase involved in cellulose biosynthesis